MIDKVIGCTIAKRYKRCWLFLGYHAARGVPIDKIAFWKGDTPDQHENIAENIAIAAERDGFPFVRYFQGHENLQILNQSLAQMCQVWSFAQVLRYVKETDQLCILLWDDRFLGTTWHIINDIVVDLINKDNDFYLFQLRIRTHDKQIINALKPKHKTVQHIFEMTIKDTPTEISYADAWTQTGMYGFDESMIISPMGAEWLLQQMHDIKPPNPEVMKQSMKYIDAEHYTELMRCVNIDSYLCYGLRPAIDTAIKESKGIYCPNGYHVNFVDEDIPLGSDTDYLTHYLNEDEHHYKNNEISLHYLNHENSIKEKQ